MIKNFNQFINESLLDKLKGPSKKEIFDEFKDNPYKLLSIVYDAGLADDDYIKEIVDELLSNVIKNQKGFLNNYLLTFCKSGISYGIKKIVELGADINFSDGEPLYYAIDNNRYDAVKTLIELGANLNLYNWCIRKAFNCVSATSLEKYDMIKLLLENGAKAPSEPILLSVLLNHDAVDGAKLFDLFVKYGEKITPVMLRDCIHMGNLFVLKVILKYIDKKWIDYHFIEYIENKIMESKTVELKEHYRKILNLLKNKQGNDKEV